MYQENETNVSKNKFTSYSGSNFRPKNVFSDTTTDCITGPEQFVRSPQPTHTICLCGMKDQLMCEAVSATNTF